VDVLLRETKAIKKGAWACFREWVYFWEINTHGLHGFKDRSVVWGLSGCLLAKNSNYCSE